jgi:hypothetical protein
MDAIFVLVVVGLTVVSWWLTVAVARLGRIE